MGEIHARHQPYFNISFSYWIDYPCNKIDKKALVIFFVHCAAAACLLLHRSAAFVKYIACTAGISFQYHSDQAQLQKL